ncbi:MAG: SWIM zinc finger family protein [Candidatus Heimdallarchaeota archaeon]
MTIISRIKDAIKLMDSDKIVFDIKAATDSWFFKVESSSENDDHLVSIRFGKPTCECKNFIYRGDLCQHSLAALFLLYELVRQGYNEKAIEHILTIKRERINSKRVANP